MQVVEHTGIDIQLESVNELFRDGTRLMCRHFNEVTTGLQGLYLDKSLYRTTERIGNFFCIVARKDGDIVGYSAAFIGPNPVASYSTVCRSEAIVVQPEHRDSFIGAMLLRATKREAKKRGASTMFWTTPPNTSYARALTKRYPVQEVTFRERI